MQDLYTDAYNSLLEKHMWEMGSLELQKKEFEGYLAQGFVLHYNQEFVPLPLFTERRIVENVRHNNVTRIAPSLYYVATEDFFTKAWEVNIDTGEIRRVPPRHVEHLNRWDGGLLHDATEENVIENSTPVNVAGGRFRAQGFYMDTEGKMVDTGKYILSNERRFVTEKRNFQGQEMLLLEEEGVVETKHIFPLREKAQGYKENVFLYRGEWYLLGREITHLASGKLTHFPELRNVSDIRVSDVSGNILVVNMFHGSVSLLLPGEGYGEILEREMGPEAFSRYDA